MASIDKIYGTREQWKEFHKWCEENCPPALKYFYSIEDQSWEAEEIMITNFPSEVDHFMLYNCDIEWVTDRIWDQHGLFVGNLLEFYDNILDRDLELEKELAKYGEI